MMNYYQTMILLKNIASQMKLDQARSGQIMPDQAGPSQMKLDQSKPD
jgi:hypothetical protein